jgi:hypothetical protein
LTQYQIGKGARRRGSSSSAPNLVRMRQLRALAANIAEVLIQERTFFLRVSLPPPLILQTRTYRLHGTCGSTHSDYRITRPRKNSQTLFVSWGTNLCWSRTILVDTSRHVFITIGKAKNMKDGNRSGRSLSCEVSLLVVSGRWSKSPRRFSSSHVCAIHFLHCYILPSLCAVGTFYLPGRHPGP